MNKKLLLLFVVGLIPCFVNALEGGITDGTSFISEMYYDTSSSSKSYADVAPTNDDYGLVTCGLGTGTKYFGAGYAYNVSGDWEYILITYDANNQKSFAPGSVDASSLCTGGYRTNNGPLSFLSGPNNNRTTGYDPDVFTAALPGKLFLMISDSSSASNLQFAYINSSNNTGWLKGSFNGVTRTFDQGSRNISVNFNSGSNDITAYTAAATSDSFDKTDSTEGIRRNRKILIGICNDSIGFSCSDAKNMTSASELPVELSSGLSAGEVNDQQTYTKHAMINGLNYSLCIGSELDIDTNPVVNESSILSGRSYTVTVYLDNDGNVNVTTDFNVTVIEKKDGTETGYVNVTIITDELAQGNNVTTFNFERTPASGSGSYTYTATINDTESGIATCGAAQQSGTSSAVSVEAVIQPQIRINGVLNGNFSFAGMINNLTIQLADSDSNPTNYFANWTVEMRETNSYSLLAPLQYQNNSGDFSGIGINTTATLLLNGSGYGTFTISPTGSKAFNDLNDSSEGLYGGHFGDYSLTFKIGNRSGYEQSVEYQGITYDCVEDCAVPFVFTNSSDFNLSTSITGADPEFHTTPTPNSNEVDTVWNKIRQISLSLTKLLQVS